VWKEACKRVFWLSYSLVLVDHSLTQTMDFSDLWKHCYRFPYASFHAVYTWLTAISSVTVSLHYLPRCLCSTVTYRAPIQWFHISNKPRLHTKKIHSYKNNTESLCYEQKHMNVLIWIETTMEYWFNYTSSSKLYLQRKLLTFGRPLCCSRRSS